jgi:hypothetical protein
MTNLGEVSLLFPLEALGMRRWSLGLVFAGLPDVSHCRYRESDLADTLSPNEALCNSPFVLRVDRVTYVGYPTSVKLKDHVQSKHGRKMVSFVSHFEARTLCAMWSLFFAAKFLWECNKRILPSHIDLLRRLFRSRGIEVCDLLLFYCHKPDFLSHELAIIEAAEEVRLTFGVIFVDTLMDMQKIATRMSIITRLMSESVLCKHLCDVAESLNNTLQFKIRVRVCLDGRFSHTQINNWLTVQGSLLEAADNSAAPLDIR